MCSVDRRRYWDGGFNGHWTSQLAPFQCSGTLFSLALLPPDTLVAFFFSFERTRLSFSYQSTDSRSICDLEGFRAEAGHYGPLFYLRRNTENRGPILSGKKFIARSTLIGREIIGHSFPLSARSKRRSLIHDFSRIIAGPCHPSFPFLPCLSLSLFFPLHLSVLQQFHSFDAIRFRGSCRLLAVATMFREERVALTIFCERRVIESRRCSLSNQTLRAWEESEER